MKVIEQVKLGYDQMKAAIVGGHGLMDAWIEIAGMTGNGKMPHVITGGAGCLLLCTGAIARAGLLPEIPAYHDFLHAAHGARKSTVSAALKARDLLTLGRLVSVMTICIDLHRSRISFEGNVPVVSP